VEKGEGVSDQPERTIVSIDQPDFPIELKVRNSEALLLGASRTYHPLENSENLPICVIDPPTVHAPSPSMGLISPSLTFHTLERRDLGGSLHIDHAPYKEALLNSRLPIYSNKISEKSGILPIQYVSCKNVTIHRKKGSRRNLGNIT